MKSKSYSRALYSTLETHQHVKLLGMEDAFKKKVSQILLKHGLLALYDGKVTLDLASSWEDTGHASTESNQPLETTVHNRPGFFKGSVIITGIRYDRQQRVVDAPAQ